jgi:hypothetical protein
MKREIHRPSGKSVWFAKEMANSSAWVFQLPGTALEEIDAGVQRLRARDQPFEQVSREDFPFTCIAGDIAAMKEEIATGRGFVVLRGLDAQKYSLEELQQIYWGLGTHFGTAMVQSYLGDLIGDIRDVSDEEPDPRKRRGYRSGGHQFVHTDSCDIVAMLSIRMAKRGGASRLASAHTIHNIMLDNCPGFLEAFYTGFFLRGTDTDAAALGRSPLSSHRVPAFGRKDGWLNCSYVRGYVDRAVQAGDAKLTPVEAAAVETFSAIGNHPDVCMEMLLQPGDMQFVNNRTVLHGRADFEDLPEKEHRRHLLRLWLSVPEWPRMSREQDTHSDDHKKVWEIKARARAAAG